jgi:hypothetical protein
MLSPNQRRSRNPRVRQRQNSKAKNVNKAACKRFNLVRCPTCGYRNLASSVAPISSTGLGVLGLLWLARKASERRCQLEEASRLGFFHEVVEPDKLLDVAISYARCITPDCNTAYAMSKKAMQDDVVRQIDERTVALDALLPAGMSDEGTRRAQDRRRKEIMHKRTRS